MSIDIELPEDVVALLRERLGDDEHVLCEFVIEAIAEKLASECETPKPASSTSLES